MLNWVRVIIVKSGNPPEVSELPDNLKAFGFTIRGAIEVIETERAGCFIIYDGKNKLTKKPKNRSEIQGTFIIARVDSSDLGSLNDQDVEILSKIYA